MIARVALEAYTIPEVAGCEIHSRNFACFWISKRAICESKSIGEKGQRPTSSITLRR
jgi:hypothetical protein